MNHACWKRVISKGQSAVSLLSPFGPLVVSGLWSNKVVPQEAKAVCPTSRREPAVPEEQVRLGNEWAPIRAVQVRTRHVFPR
ncbi:hypothetical protein RSAG8_05245, partial [Rhizoctonia solani AG-8 WAC10335]